MTDELRSGLVAATERFRDDLALGKLDDPHVAFVVLVNPDAPPSIVVLADAGAHHLGRVRQKNPDDDTPDRRGRFFTFEDVVQASDALSAVELGIRMSSYSRKDKEPFGQYLVRQIATSWHRRRDVAMDRLLKKADEERRRPVVCGCGRRFTKRGHGTHLARHRWCPDAQAHQNGSAITPSEARGSGSTPPPGEQT